jgi:hypothetical protein
MLTYAASGDCSAQAKGGARDADTQVLNLLALLVQKQYKSSTKVQKLTQKYP